MPDTAPRELKQSVLNNDTLDDLRPSDNADAQYGARGNSRRKYEVYDS